MPAVQSEHIIFMAGVIEILVQLLKGPLPEQYRQYIPWVLVVLGLFLGLALGVYYGTEPVAALFEGFFGAASALGFYQLSSRVPVVNAAFGSKGWLGDSG